MKRVSIATEVVAFPSLLFLDEPTTFLDSDHSLVVIQMLRELARGRVGGREGGWQGGMAVIASIHQPSKEVFELFDSLLMLGKGGNVVYVGPTRGENGVVAYFEKLPGIIPLEEGENPASWVLTCVQADMMFGLAVPKEENALNACNSEGIPIDYTALYTTSDLKRKTSQEIQEICQAILVPSRTLTRTSCKKCSSVYRALNVLMCYISSCDKCGLSSSFPPLRPIPFLIQLHVCSRRAWLTFWRLPSYQWVRIGGTAAMAIMLSGIYHGQPQETISDLMGYLGLIFIGLTFTAVINSTAVFELMFQERPAFYRERFAGSYSVGAYALSWLLVEMPYVFVQSLLFLLLLYFPCGFALSTWRVLWFWAFLYLYMLFATAFGQAVAALSPSTQSAKMVYNTVAPVFSIMSGMTFMPGDIPQGWLPLWILCPLNKVFEGIVMTQWWEEPGGKESQATVDIFNSDTRSFEKTTKWKAIQGLFGDSDHYQEGLHFSFAHRWRNLGTVIVFIFACNLLFMSALKWRRFEKR